MKLLLLIGALYALPPVTISVYPSISMVPATVRLTVLAPRHVDNRRICLSYDGGEMRRSCEDLQGIGSRRSWTFYWDVRTAGEYIATAKLTRMESGREHIYTSNQSFRVIGIE
jgi:hypothetical protein